MTRHSPPPALAGNPTPASPPARTAPPPWLTAAALVICAGIAIYLYIYIFHRVSRAPTDTDYRGDFSYFYTAAKAMLHHQDIYLAQPPDKDRPGYIYPPLIAFLYQPLALLDIVTAARVSLIVNVLAIASTVAMASRALLARFAPDTRWQHAALVAMIAVPLSFDKIKADLQMLQTNSLIACGIAAGLLLLDRSPFWAGAALGFSMNIKYQALALLVWLLLRRRWKAAGATVLWTAFWALLPALSVGFTQELSYLVRGVSGVLRLVGINLGPDTANVEPISSTFSVSLTSAAARFIESRHLSTSPYLLSGIVGILWLGIIILLYRRRRLPLLAWPPARAQIDAPWRALAGIEWIVVLAGLLAFSPQTNMRHMVLTTFVYILGVVIAFEARGKTRWLAIAGIAALWMGLNLPPGSRVDKNGATITGGAAAHWQFIGGPAWGLILAAALLAAAGLLQISEPRASRSR